MGKGKEKENKAEKAGKGVPHSAQGGEDIRTLASLKGGALKGGTGKTCGTHSQIRERKEVGGGDGKKGSKE